MRMPSSWCPYCDAGLHPMDAVARRCPNCGREPWPKGLLFALAYSIMAAVSGPLIGISVLSGNEFATEDGRALTGLAAALLPVVMLLAVSLPGALSAYGLWNHRTWTRPWLIVWLILMHVMLLPVFAGLMDPVEIWMAVAMSVIFVPVVWLYLYAKTSVVGYYAAIAGETAGDATA